MKRLYCIQLSRGRESTGGATVAHRGQSHVYVQQCVWLWSKDRDYTHTQANTFTKIQSMTKKTHQPWNILPSSGEASETEVILGILFYVRSHYCIQVRSPSTLQCQHSRNSRKNIFWSTNGIRKYCNNNTLQKTSGPLFCSLWLSMITDTVVVSVIQYRPSYNYFLLIYILRALNSKIKQRTVLSKNRHP